MTRQHRVSHTIDRDGILIKHPNNLMDAPLPQDMSRVVKKAIIKELNKRKGKVD